MFVSVYCGKERKEQRWRDDVWCEYEGIWQALVLDGGHAVHVDEQL